MKLQYSCPLNDKCIHVYHPSFNARVYAPVPREVMARYVLDLLDYAIKSLSRDVQIEYSQNLKKLDISV